jgi:hypothetical protein
MFHWIRRKLMGTWEMEKELKGFAEKLTDLCNSYKVKFVHGVGTTEVGVVPAETPGKYRAQGEREAPRDGLLLVRTPLPVCEKCGDKMTLGYFSGVRHLDGRVAICARCKLFRKV